MGILMLNDKYLDVYLTHLKNKINSLSSTKWNYLYDEHLKQVLNFYNKGMSEDNSYFRDCISRANKVFEGVIRLLFDESLKLDSTLRTGDDRVYNLTNILLRNNKIADIFGNKLDNYRISYRNPETHDIFIDFSGEDAKKALNDALVFLDIGVTNTKLIKNTLTPINDRDYLYLIVESFIRSFAIYTNFFTLYDQRYNGIYSAEIDILLDLIKKYHRNTIFSNEISLEPHPITNRLRPHFKVSIKNQELTLTVIKITEYNLITYATFSRRLIDKIDKYTRTFRNLFFLIWSFTRRTALDIILSFFRDLPHFHLYGLRE